MSGKSVGAPAVIDRRAARTRRLLHEALMRLILRAHYDTITVQNLLDEADVGRSTFYAHYAGKDDLLRKGFERLREELNTVGDMTGQGGANPFGFSAMMFAHAARYKEHYRAMVGSRGGAIVVGELRRVLLSVVEPEIEGVAPGDIPRDLLALFAVDAFQTVLKWWLERRPELAPEQIDQIFGRLMQASLSVRHRPLIIVREG